MERVVVIGASLAGLRAAQGVRAAGHAGPLLVVGDEPHLPYTRPPLSKQLLAGEQTHADCNFPVEAVDAEWRLGAAAIDLDLARREVTLADGDVVPYDRLIVATGCRARTWPGPGADLDGVLTLRGVEDAQALRAAFDRRPRVAIVGAGFVGCEVAATARKEELDVTLIDVAPQPMVPLGPDLGARCAQLHRDHGVALRLGTGVAALTGEGHVDGVELADGSRVDADLVLVALGAIPNTEWLAGSGLARDAGGGLLCDATLTTSDPDVLAAGDVVSWPHPLAGGEVVRVEHWTTAAEHGGVAGRNAVVDAPAERAAHVTPPYFWSDQYDIKIQAVGFPGRAEALEIVDAEGPRLVAEGRDADGRLVGVITFNNAKKLAAYRRQLAQDVVAA
jgi:NADPH-dependent 2,4-dienoyl-CoA reductase/sulfur reductase-like enzyme